MLVLKTRKFVVSSSLVCYFGPHKSCDSVGKAGIGVLRLNAQ